MMKDKPYELLIQQNESELTITVKPKVAKRNLIILRLWLILWILSGGLVMSFLFAPIGSNEKLLLIVWIAFWLYFAVKGYNILWWKTNGYEQLIIRKDTCIIHQHNSKTGGEKIQVSPNQFQIQTVDFTRRNFTPQVNESFFSLGQETLIINGGKKEYRYGKQLRKEDAERIMKTIKKSLRQN